MKITVVGYSPASINTYVNIIKELQDKDYNVNELLLHKYGEDIWGCTCVDVEDFSEQQSREFLISEFKDTDLVLFSLEGGKIDSQIPEICKELAICSVGNIFTFWEDDIDILHR